jgi:Peptidase A4 family
MTTMTRLWAVSFVILSTLLMSSAIVLPTTVAASPSAAAAPKVLQNSLLAGYAAVSANGSVTAVYGSFVIPKVTCDATAPSYQAVYFAAGMDGFNSPDFEYVGVQEFCQVGPNSPDYFAVSSGSFNSIEGIVPVKAGDLISVSIKVSGGNFHYTFKDVTTGKSATDSSLATGAALDAAECGVLGSLPFSKFAPVTFGKVTGVSGTCDARINGIKHALGDPGKSAKVYKLVLVDPATMDILAIPSAFSGMGSSFTVTWKNAQ